MSVDDSPSTAVDRRRRIRALLAGGLVLGLGAAGTLAAWTDSGFATGVFSSGQFNIQGNPSITTPPASETWSDHYTAGNAAPLQFSTNFDGLSPGTTVYAPFSIRIDPDRASYNAAVHLTSAVSTGDSDLMSRLAWEARTGIDPATCAAGNFTGGAPLVSPTSMSSNYNAPPTPPTFTVSNAGAPNTAPTTVCLAITMESQPPGTAPTDPAWTFDAPVATTWGFSAVSDE